jgi:hypothetical protein
MGALLARLKSSSWRVSLQSIIGTKLTFRLHTSVPLVKKIHPRTHPRRPLLCRAWHNRRVVYYSSPDPALSHQSWDANVSSCDYAAATCVEKLLANYHDAASGLWVDTGREGPMQADGCLTPRLRELFCVCALQIDSAVSDLKFTEPHKKGIWQT